jgi:hypothetical protein
MIPRAEGGEEASGDRVQAAQRKALKARERRQQIELEARRLYERAEAAALKAAEARQAREWARKERARRAVRLTTAEEDARQAEARHAATTDVARRLAEIAAHAAAEQNEARKAEEEALAEAARIEDEFRSTGEVRSKLPAEHAAPVVESDPPVLIPTVEELVSDRTRSLGAVGLLLGALVLVVAVTARSLTAPTAAVRRASEPRAVEARTPAGTVVPDARGLSAFDARRRLVAAGLALAGVVPTPGTPGLVVRLTPAVGRRITPGTPVTLHIGVEPNRYELEATSSITPGFSAREERR